MTDIKKGITSAQASKSGGIANNTGTIRRSRAIEVNLRELQLLLLEGCVRDDTRMTFMECTGKLARSNRRQSSPVLVKGVLPPSEPLLLSRGGLGLT